MVFRNRTFDTADTDSYWLQFGNTLPLAVDVSAQGLFLSAPRTATRRVSIEFGLPFGTRARLSIYDAQGRLVRSLLDASLGPGRHEIAWDLRDDAGSALGPAACWVRLDAGTERRTARVIVLR